jgi:circadian clock protein KaiC
VSTRRRTPTGISGLDGLIGGGFPANRSVLLIGETGTGKTSFALQFISAGLACEEHAVFLTVDEKPQHIIEDATDLGWWDLGATISNGSLTLLDAAAYFTATRGRNDDATIDARLIASDLAHQIKKINARRLVIDSFTALIPPAAGRWATYDYLRSLIHSLEDNLNCTTLLTCRPDHDADPQASCEAAATLASGVIELRLEKGDQEYARTVFVRKMRGTRIDLTEHPFRIESPAGFTLETPGARQRIEIGLTD